MCRVEIKKRKTKVWVLSGTSESSGHFSPLVFSKEPTENQLDKIVFNWYGQFDTLELEEIEVDEEFNE